MTTADKPHVDDAPGLIWRPMRSGWEARWQARTDLIEKGFHPKSVRLWKGLDLTEEEGWHISDRCQQLQAKMLVFARGGIPLQQPGVFNGTLASLIDCYMSDPDSTYGKLRWKTRQGYRGLCARLAADYGTLRIAELKARTILRWHEAWSDNGAKVAMGHSMVAMFRTLLSFGSTILEDSECTRMSTVMSNMRFKMPKARTDHLNAGQAAAIRATAREYGYQSIALAQAIQFEAMFRQGDTIGQWVPIAEPGLSTVHHEGKKWIVGIRWEEIGEDLKLRHVTSKRQKPITFNFNLAPMVMEELRYAAQTYAWSKAGARAIMDGAPMPPLLDVVSRADLPPSGPVVVCEQTALPWAAHHFRRTWRTIARAAGIPDHIKSMDSRSGGATEASASGADLDDIRKAMTHSQVSQTVKYSRDDEERVAEVMRLRAASRNKSET
jgi:hypothetical protein